MTIFNNKKNITEQFRRAARSCNDWRDTLFYTGVGCLTVASTQWDTGFTAFDIMGFAWVRELFRAVAWVRPNGKENSFKNFSHSAATVAMIGVAQEVAIGFQAGDVPGYLTFHPVGPVVNLAMATSLCALSGGVKNVYANYRDTLFDYPRKKNPPRTPHKKSLKDEFKEAWRGMIDKVGSPVPEGSFAPIPVRRREATAPALPAPTA